MTCSTGNENAMEWNGMEWNGMEWNGMQQIQCPSAGRPQKKVNNDIC